MNGTSGNEIDPLTAPIEEVMAASTEATAETAAAELAAAEPFAAPATPPEFRVGLVDHGSGGPAPVPPLEEARAGDEQPQAKVGMRCECGRWEVINPGTNEVEETTGCTETTRNPNSRFAPGHDARLKGLLIRAGERGHRVREIGTDTNKLPTTVAARISSAMARRVEEGIKRRKR